MIGLLGAKIWIENRVNFANPVNLVPVAAGLIFGIGLDAGDPNAFFKITENFVLGGIAMGTIVVIAGYHLARLVAPNGGDEGAVIAVGQTGAHVEDHAPPHAHDDHKH